MLRVSPSISQKTHGRMIPILWWFFKNAMVGCQRTTVATMTSPSPPSRCQDRLVLAVALGVGFGSSVASCVLMSGRDAPAGWAGAWDGAWGSLMVDQLKVGVKLRWLSLWLSGGEGAKELWLYHVVSFTCCIHIPSKNAGQGATMSFPTTVDLFGWWVKKMSTFIICHFRMICVGMCCSIQDFPWIDWR